ncbi:MAG: efflux RND transporter periplasmic adaptor subunit [Cyanobacteria bacterium REEB67]|nr:efflux RND transporter periplasmic adaptor subunit [Cyanobacteria bacterium REEB67]
MQLDVDPQSESNIEPRVASVAAPRRKPPALVPVALLVVLGLGGLLTAGILPRLGRAKDLESIREAVLREIPEVRVQKAKYGSSDEDLILPANIEPVQDIPVYARTSGYLKSRLVDIGDRVKAGQALAVIEAPEVVQELDAARADLRQARSALRSAQADLSQGKSNLKTAEANVKKMRASLTYSRAQVSRYTELAQEGAISYESRDSKVRDVDTDVASLSASDYAVEAAKQQVLAYSEKVGVAQAQVESQMANQRKLEAQAGFQNVLSPCDGVITSRNVDPGALVTSGSQTSNSELLRIARTDVLRVFIFVPQAFFESIHPGLDAEITVAEKPGQTFIGKVARVAGGLDGLSRTLRVEVRIPNPKNLLLPGMYARVRFVCHRAHPPLIVPSNCVVVKPEGQFICVVGKGNAVHFNAVDLFRDHGPEVEIVQGLSAGDLVVLDPPDNIADGSVVKPVAVKEAKPSR